mmetsp:Transcript_22504/g.59795  ORF Transcript_22504/g.59795 Transcript_22504/m.59795 type:complete len:245 (-) Transcript_22504:43-777(-)
MHLATIALRAIGLRPIALCAIRFGRVLRAIALHHALPHRRELRTDPLLPLVPHKPEALARTLPHVARSGRPRVDTLERSLGRRGCRAARAHHTLHEVVLARNWTGEVEASLDRPRLGVRYGRAFARVITIGLRPIGLRAIGLRAIGLARIRPRGRRCSSKRGRSLFTTGLRNVGGDGCLSEGGGDRLRVGTAEVRCNRDKSDEDNGKSGGDSGFGDAGPGHGGLFGGGDGVGDRGDGESFHWKC